MKDLRSLSLAQYLILTFGVGLAIFIAFFIVPYTLAGFIAAAVSWRITRDSDEADRVAAAGLAWAFFSIVQLLIMGIYYDY